MELNKDFKTKKPISNLHKKPFKFIIDKSQMFPSYKWSVDEDKKLLNLISELTNTKKIVWKEIAAELPGKSKSQCYARYRQINPTFFKGKWTKEEKLNLILLVEEYGTNWRKIQSFLKTRSSKQIRAHYYGSIKTCLFTPQDDELIRTLYLKYGTKFSLMGRYFDGKATEQIKQRFYSQIKKTIRNQILGNEESGDQSHSNNSNYMGLNSENSKSILNFNFRSYFI